MSQRERVLVVGEDFGHSPVEYHHEAYALSGASGRRLAQLAGLPFLVYALHAERLNVVEVPEDWRDPTKVAASVDEIVERMRDRRTILLGAKVAKAFNAEHVPLFTWTTFFSQPDITFARVPHPSGRSFWWNEPDNTEKAAAFLKEALA